VSDVTLLSGDGAHGCSDDSSAAMATVRGMRCDVVLLCGYAAGAGVGCGEAGASCGGVDAVEQAERGRETFEAIPAESRTKAGLYGGDGCVSCGVSPESAGHSCGERGVLGGGVAGGAGPGFEGSEELEGSDWAV